MRKIRHAVQAPLRSNPFRPRVASGYSDRTPAVQYLVSQKMYPSPSPCFVTSPLNVRFGRLGHDGVRVISSGVIPQGVFPLVCELLRHHVLDRQSVTGGCFLAMLGFHQLAEDRKCRSGRSTPVGLSGSDALSDLLVSRYPDPRVAEPVEACRANIPHSPRRHSVPVRERDRPQPCSFPAIGRSDNHMRVVHVPILRQEPSRAHRHSLSNRRCRWCRSAVAASRAGARRSPSPRR